VSIFDEIADKHHSNEDPYNPFEAAEAELANDPLNPPDHMSPEAKGWDFCYNSKDTDVFKLEISDGDARFLCRDCGKVPAFVGDDAQETISLNVQPLVKVSSHQCNCNPMVQWGCDCWPGFELEIQPNDDKDVYPADMLRQIEAQYGKGNTLRLLQAIGGRVVGEFARQVRMEANTMGCGPSAEGIRNCTYNFVAEAEKAGPWPKAMISLFRP